MLRSIWRGVLVLVKGAAVLVAILGVLLMAAVIWFSFNPLFPSPETGELHASASRELRLEAGQTTLAITLEARLNENAVTPDSGRPDPPTLLAAIVPTDGSPLESVEFRIAPAEATSALNDLHETDPGRLRWTIDCPEGTRDGCRHRVVLLVEAKPSQVDRTWRLTVTGNMRYPTFVRTPGWSSFDLDLGSVGNEHGMGPSPLAEANGAVELTAEQPVVVVPLRLEHSGTRERGNLPAAALRVAIDAVRLTETAPAGLDAPEPVRVTVLDSDGAVLAKQAIRPGQGGRSLGLALGQCSSTCVTDYQLAFEWMDRRPGADYQLTWRSEVVGLPVADGAPGPVSVRAGDPRVAELSGSVRASAPDGGELRGRLLGLRLGALPGGDQSVHPVHVQLRVTATVDPVQEVGTTIIRIQPNALDGHALDVPFDLRPGETGSIVVNLEDGCAPRRCLGWRFDVVPLNRDGTGDDAVPDVAWQFEARAWQLVPDEAPFDLTLDVQ